MRIFLEVSNTMSMWAQSSFPKTEFSHIFLFVIILFIVLLQNKLLLAENDENLINVRHRVSAHSEGQKF